MASLVLTAGVRRSLRGSAALFKADIAVQCRSWVLRGWLIAVVLAEAFRLTGALVAGRTSPAPASTLLALSLDGFLFVWSTLIIVHCAGCVSLEAEIVADSILSRPCTRTQYICAKLGARIAVVMGIFLLVASASGYTAWRYAAGDMTLATMCTGIGVVGMAVLLLVVLGVGFSVTFNNTIVSVVSLLLLWYVASPIFAFAGAPYLSPASLAQNLPQILKDPTAPEVLSASATPSSITVVFSRRLDPRTAEEPANYSVECPAGVPVAPATATYDRESLRVLLSGLALPAGAGVVVTVRGVTDAGGTEVSAAAARATASVNTGLAPKAAPAPKTAEAAANSAPVRVVRCVATPSSLQVWFSRPLRVVDAETVGYYAVESPLGTRQTPRAAAYAAGGRSVVLSGLRLNPDAPVKVTVRDVHGADGAPLGPRANSAVCSGVATWKYVVGFGAPALLTVLLSIVWFSRRDL